MKFFINDVIYSVATIAFNTLDFYTMNLEMRHGVKFTNTN